MARQRARELEWQVQEDVMASAPLDVAWEQPEPGAGFHRGRRGWVLTAALLFVLGAFVWTLGRAWYQAERLRHDLQVILAQEAAAVAARDERALLALLDERAARGWRGQEQTHTRVRGLIPAWLITDETIVARRVEEVRVNGDRAEVRVVYRLGENPPLFWQRHFFRRGTDGRWRISAPTLDAWGERQTIETPHLRIIYYTRDTAAVVGAAPFLEAFTSSLSRDVGMAQLPGGQRIEVAIVPRTYNLDPRIGEPRVEVAAPELRGVLMAEPAATQVTREVARALTRHTLAWQQRYASARTNRLATMQPLVQAMADWEAEMVGAERSWQWCEMGRALASGPVSSTAAHARLVSVVDYVATRFGREHLHLLLGVADRVERPDLVGVGGPFGVADGDFVAGWQKHREQLAAAQRATC